MINDEIRISSMINYQNNRKRYVHAVWCPATLHFTCQTLDREKRTRGLGTVVCGSQSNVWTYFSWMFSRHECTQKTLILCYIFLIVLLKYVLASMSVCSEQHWRTCIIYNQTCFECNGQCIEQILQYPMMMHDFQDTLYKAK